MRTLNELTHVKKQRLQIICYSHPHYGQVESSSPVQVRILVGRKTSIIHIGILRLSRQVKRTPFQRNSINSWYWFAMPPCSGYVFFSVGDTVNPAFLLFKLQVYPDGVVDGMNILKLE